MIKVLADQNLYKLPHFLPKEVEISFYDPNKPIPDLSNFDAWLLRTVTKVNPNKFPELPPRLKFIGTGSSGSDHVDIEYLNHLNVHFVDAKGCNATAVAEHVATSLLLLMDEISNILELKVGIVGVGAVGQKTDLLLRKLGFQTVLFDPPRERRDSSFTSASQKEILECRILTFHVPFTKSGVNKTYHWLDQNKLKENSFEVIINAARGGIIDETAVLHAKSNGRIKHLIMDVWENEPDFNPEFVNECFIATPHIAGYSEQAKLNASSIICKQLCDFFGFPEIKNGFKIDTQNIQVDDDSSLKTALKSVHPILDYDQKFRDLINSPDKITDFRNLRTNHPYRNEYHQISVPNEVLNIYPELKKLGLTIA